MNKPTVIVLLSGGLDSAALLYKLLKEDKYDIYVHHIEMIYNDKLYIVSKIASDNCVNWCKKNIKDFTYTTSAVDISYSSTRAGMPIIAFICSQLVLRSNITNLCYITLGLFFYKKDPKHYYHSLVNNLYTIYTAGFGDHKNTIIPIVFPLMNSRKIELYNSLPKELAKLTWGCLTPIYKNNYIYPCNNCEKCEQLEEAGIIHNIIKL